MIRAALVVLAIFWASEAPAQVLWQETEVGISEEDVLAAFNSAKPEKNGEEMGKGLIERVQISNYEFFTHQFDVSFFFDSDGLGLVLLSMTSHSTRHEAA